MKKSLPVIVYFNIVFTFCIIFLSGVIPIHSELPVTTILDYYLMIPDELLQCEINAPLSKKHKLDLIKKKDLKKGFILSSTKDGGLPVEVALFTDDYLGITVLAVNTRCQSGCMCRRLDFFFISGGKLMKSSSDGLFPKAEEIEKAAKTADGYEFELAGDGKKIKVVSEETKKTLLVIEWSGGTFNLP